MLEYLTELVNGMDTYVMVGLGVLFLSLVGAVVYFAMNGAFDGFLQSGSNEDSQQQGGQMQQEQMQQGGQMQHASQQQQASQPQENSQHQE